MVATPKEIKNKKKVDPFTARAAGGRQPLSPPARVNTISGVASYVIAAEHSQQQLQVVCVRVVARFFSPTPVLGFVRFQK